MLFFVTLILILCYNIRVSWGCHGFDVIDKLIIAVGFAPYSFEMQLNADENNQANAFFMNQLANQNLAVACY